MMAVDIGRKRINKKRLQFINGINQDGMDV